MCIIIHKPKEGIIPGNILDNAERLNMDGFGITFLDNMKTIKTMDYNKARVLVESERPFVAHYRYATRGKTDADNCHPFPTMNGVLYSNGTVADLGDKDTCDTAIVASMLERTPKKYWKDLLSMTETRFAIVNIKGEVSRFGDWHMKDGVFYSKNNCFGTYSRSSSLGPYYNQTNYGWEGYSGAGTSTTPVTKSEWVRQANGTYSRNVTDPKPDLSKNNTVIGFAGAGVGAGDWDGHPDELDVTPNDNPIDDNDIMDQNEIDEIRQKISDDEIFEIAAAYNAGEMTQAEYQEALCLASDPSYEYDDDEMAMSNRTQHEIEGGMGDWGDLDLLAVYGTLKCGHGNHQLIIGEEFLGEAQSIDRLRMAGTGIPYVYDGDCDEGHNINVELYHVKGVNAKIDIDWLEGHPNHYKRTRKQFVTSMGIEAEAWVYIAQHEPRAESEFYATFK